jgi:hypothetical protein
MRLPLNPNRAANPLLWILLIGTVLAIAGSIFQAIQPKREGDRPHAAQTQPKAETPKTLMQGGYKTLKGASNQTHLDITMAIARNYLDEANRQSQPLVWLRTEYNNALADLKGLQNTRLEYARGEAEQVAALNLKLFALSVAINAVAQDKTGKLDKSLDLQKLTQQGENFFSLFDSQVIEKRYPMP